MGNTLELIRDIRNRNSEKASEEQGAFGNGRSAINYVMSSADQVLEKHNTRLEFKSTYSTVRLHNDASTTLQCMVSLKSDDDEMQQGKVFRYNNVDLVCVIDVSGSMSGIKLELVKLCLLYVIDQLMKGDRISLITFSTNAEVKCELTSNYAFLKEAITSLTAGGNTNIRAGLKEGYNIVQSNRSSSNVQCVWLLSDGRDTTGFRSEMIRQHLTQAFNRSGNPAFTIHTLGFGNDHDSKLMKEIAKARGGKFIFIEKEAELNKAMANLLGGAFSAISHKALIKVECITNGALQPKIEKAYGDFKKSQGRSSDVFEYEVVQYRAGSSNCYVFEVSLPPVREGDQSSFGNQKILQATAVLQKLDNLVPLKLSGALEVTLLNPKDVLKKELPDEEVVENHARVRVVEMMRNCVDLMELGHHAQVTAILNQAGPLLDQAPQTDKIKELKNDVAEIRRRIEQRDFIGGYRYTCGQERYHGERFYAVGQQRSQGQALRLHAFRSRKD